MSHVLRVRHVLHLHVLFDADRVDEQGAALPMSDGVAVVAQLDVVERHLPLVWSYMAKE